MRWWDGQQWGEPADSAPARAGQDPKTMSMFSHLLGLVLGFVGPLIIYLMNGEKDPFIRHHAAEALNFQITVAIGLLVSIATSCILIGFVILPFVILADLVFAVMAAIAANKGEWYRYPVTIRIVPGAIEA
jgi:uncharacterized protein